MLIVVKVLSFIAFPEKFMTRGRSRGQKVLYLYQRCDMILGILISIILVNILYLLFVSAFHREPAVPRAEYNGEVQPAAPAPALALERERLDDGIFAVLPQRVRRLLGDV